MCIHSKTDLPVETYEQQDTIFHALIDQLSDALVALHASFVLCISACCSVDLLTRSREVQSDHEWTQWMHVYCDSYMRGYCWLCNAHHIPSVAWHCAMSVNTAMHPARISAAEAMSASISPAGGCSSNAANGSTNSSAAAGAVEGA